jgi:hypothetical protein
VETPGGRIQIQWDYEAKATPSGQLAFFAEFLKTSGVYWKWVHLTPMHAAKENLMMLISNVRKALNHVKAIAEQLPSADRWKTLLAYIVARIVPKRTPRLPIPGAFLPA